MLDLHLKKNSVCFVSVGAVALAEYVADSFHLLRLDLRENDIKTAGLMALSLALKVNESVTRMDVDKETKKESVSCDISKSCAVTKKIYTLTSVLKKIVLL